MGCHRKREELQRGNVWRHVRRQGTYQAPLRQWHLLGLMSTAGTSVLQQNKAPCAKIEVCDPKPTNLIRIIEGHRKIKFLACSSVLVLCGVLYLWCSCRFAASVILAGFRLANLYYSKMSNEVPGEIGGNGTLLDFSGAHLGTLATCVQGRPRPGFCNSTRPFVGHDQYFSVITQKFCLGRCVPSLVPPPPASS